MLTQWANPLIIKLLFAIASSFANTKQQSRGAGVLIRGQDMRLRVHDVQYPLRVDR